MKRGTKAFVLELILSCVLVGESEEVAKQKLIYTAAAAAVCERTCFN